MSGDDRYKSLVGRLLSTSNQQLRKSVCVGGGEGGGDWGDAISKTDKID